MRLTLRTMLAYLDDILDLGDARELGKKIEESKFASDLVHRIRNSTQRPQLAAPKPDGKGMGLDPNTVAEYLDNTLPPDQVPDFEKVCLESDVHLAEVASCHQILTLVLGQPADVEIAVRERIYRIGLSDPSDAARQAEKSATPPAMLDLLDIEELGSPRNVEAANGGLARIERRPNKVAPATGGFPIKSLAVTLVMAFLLALVGFRAMGEFNASHPLWRLLGDSSPQDTAGVKFAETTPAQGVGQVVTTKGSQNTRESGPGGPTPVSPSAPASRGESAPPPAEPISPSGQGASPGGQGAPLRAEGPRIPDAVPPPNAEPISPPNGRDLPSDSVTPSGDTDPPDAAGDLVTSEVVSAGPMLEPVLTSVGRFISEQQVSARYDVRDDVWKRLTPDTPLSAQDELLVFPTYRPQILVKSGVKVTLDGPTRVGLEIHEADGRSGLRVQYGRMLLVPIADEGASLLLSFGPRRVTLRLLDIASSAAIDVQNYLPPGADPGEVAAEQVIRVFGVSGQTHWQEETGGEPQRIQPGQILVALGPAAARVQEAGQLPLWVENSELKPIDRSASLNLIDYLTADRPLSLTLLEQAGIERQRRVEVRALANRSLVVLEIFDTILRALDDPRERSYWPDHFQMLRFALVQGPESAPKLQAMINRLFGESSPTVYSLIRGYSPEQLADGGADELVRLLEHPQMSVRVLAFLNLEAITGMTHLFLPWQEPAKEKDKVAKWRQSLKAGRITYQVAPWLAPSEEPPE